MVSTLALQTGSAFDVLGLLSLLAGQHILETTGSEALASGYFVAASKSFNFIGGDGVCQMLHKRFPSFISGPIGASEPWLATIFSGSAARMPTMIRAPPSTSNATSHTNDSSEIAQSDESVPGDNLDTITSVAFYVLINVCPIRADNSA